MKQPQIPTLGAIFGPIFQGRTWHAKVLGVYLLGYTLAKL